SSSTSLLCVPTRRSSALVDVDVSARESQRVSCSAGGNLDLAVRDLAHVERIFAMRDQFDGVDLGDIERSFATLAEMHAQCMAHRSEEHTSELQSRENLVC